MIAYADDRATALDRLDRALATYVIAGVTTNAAFSRALIARDDVRAGDQDTGLLERVLDDLALPAPDDLVVAGVLAEAGTSHPPGPWWRALEGHGEARVVHGTITIGDRQWSNVQLRAGEHPSDRYISLDGIQRRYAIAVADDAIWVFRDGHHVELRTARAARDGARALAGSLEAPMPGTVWAVNVVNGETVSKGDVLMVLESMKMELSITAPCDGVVAGLQLSAGDRVALKQPLVAVVAPQEEDA